METKHKVFISCCLLGAIGFTISCFTQFWFPVLILVVSSLSLMVSVWWFKKGERGYREDSGWAVAGVIFLLVLLLGLWPIFYASSINTIARMKAFFCATKSAYEYTIDETENIEIKAVNTAKLSPQEILDAGELFTYRDLGQMTGNRIKEFLSEVEWYNKTLEAYRLWNHFFFTQGFTADPPLDLTYIKFNENKERKPEKK